MKRTVAEMAEQAECARQRVWLLKRLRDLLQEEYVGDEPTGRIKSREGVLIAPSRAAVRRVDYALRALIDRAYAERLAAERTRVAEIAEVELEDDGLLDEAAFAEQMPPESGVRRATPTAKHGCLRACWQR